MESIKVSLLHYEKHIFLVIDVICTKIPITHKMLHIVVEPFRRLRNSHSTTYDPPMAQNIYGPPIANKHFNVKIWSVLNPSDLFWTTFDQVWTSLSILNKFE